MKYRLLDLLKDVADGSQLKLGERLTIKEAPVSVSLTAVPCSTYCGLRNCPVQQANVTPVDCAKCYSKEIIEGELVSESGHRVPIRGGIPRFLSNDMAGWLRKNQETFSLEWKMFRFGERNWGQDIEYRKNLFLKGLGAEPKDLAGRLIFDAGCGSGLLSMALARSFGMEVVALDLAFGIEQAYVANTSPFVHFIQGSVLEPPVKDKSVDYAYCGGVLVALPDAKAGFKALKPPLKPGGRFFVWMYHPIDDRHHPRDKAKMRLYNFIRENITSPLPIQIQYILYMLALPVFIFKRTITNLFGKEKNTITWREKMQNLTDMFSPLYQHRFSEEEIVEWYRELGFSNAQISYTEEYGFGARGDVPA